MNINNKGSNAIYIIRMAMVIITVILVCFAGISPAQEVINLGKSDHTRVVSIASRQESTHVVVTGFADDGVREYDETLVVSINGKKGDFIKVTFAGSMRGASYGYIRPIRALFDRRNEDDYPLRHHLGTLSEVGKSGSTGQEWRPFYVMYMYELIADATVSFCQHFYNRRGILNAYNPCEVWLAYRVATIEIIDPPQGPLQETP